MRGITIKLKICDTAGTDPFNHPLTKDAWVDVENVLVAPASSQDIEDSLTLYGKRAIYTLGIPKGDTHIWEDTEVEFFGRRWRTIGYALEGIEEMIPLQWNKQIQVEVIEG